MKPVIGIVSGILRDGPLATERVYANREYIEAIEQAGGVPVLLPVIKTEKSLDRFIDLCDGFLFTGGVDLSQLCYGEQPLPLLGQTNADMDSFQIPFFQKAMKSDKAILAICRGVQVMNVSCGGTLFQDVSYAEENVLKHVQNTDIGNVSQIAWIEPESRLHSIFGDKIEINSYHHQSVKKVANGFVVVAKAQDGIIEAIESLGNTFVIGVQWHPELMLHKSDTMLPLFKAFVQAAENKII